MGQWTAVSAHAPTEAGIGAIVKCTPICTLSKLFEGDLLSLPLSHVLLLCLQFESAVAACIQKFCDEAS